MVEHSGRKHFTYGASSSERWINCPGSIVRAAGMPTAVASTYAADGEEAHELLEYSLVNGYTNADEAFVMGEFKWTHNHDTEQERLISVQTALDNINELIEAYSPDCETWTEIQFRFPSREAPDDSGGTTDFAMYVPLLDICYVIDYKHGAGKAVDVQDNYQLKMYMCCVREAMRQRGMTTPHTMYVGRIIQPRAFHKDGGLRTVEYNDAVLDEYIGAADNAIRQSRAQAPPIKPGPWCRWCPAYMACPEAAAERMDKFFGGVSVTAPNAKPLPDVQGLDVEYLARLLEAAPTIREYLAAAEAQAIALARQGVPIPRHKLVYAQARRKWHGDEREIAVALAHMIGGEAAAFMPPQLVTITEAERMVKAAIYERVGKGKDARKYVKEANEYMAHLTTKDTSGSLTIVDRDDKRPEVNLAGMLTFNQPSDSTTS